MNAIPKKVGGFAAAVARSTPTKADKADPELKSLVVKKLAGSVLTEADGKRMEIKLVSAAETSALGLPSATDGFLIPYFDLNGKSTEFFRVRYMRETRKGFDVYSKKKAIRYGQVPGTINEAYLPPLGVKWAAVAADPDQPVVITEGELKAACATKHGVPTIGLGGVWCFTSARHGLILLPIFDEFVWAERKVTICFDSDASTNMDIVRAENALARSLSELGAEVFIARIPPDGDAKCGIDDFILAHGHEKFMQQVLDKAAAFDQNAALHAMNEEVVYIRNPGLIYSYENDYKMSCDAFTGHAFSNRFHMEYTVVEDPNGNKKTKTTRVKTAKAWLDWSYRAELKGLTFAPGEGKITESGHLNAWSGWGFTEPTKGDITPWQSLLNHVFGEELALRQWFERWVAFPIQNPGAKQANAVMVWGIGEGTGKTLIGHIIMMLYGKHATELKDSDLEDTRNEWAENIQFALADDVTGQDSRKLANRLKTLVTQKVVRLNPKYIPSYTVPDCINYYFTSNDPNALNISSGDRRYMIHEVLAGKLAIELRKTIIEWRATEEGLNALAWHLLNLPMGDYDPNVAPPESEAKSLMALAGKGDVGEWAHDFMADIDNVLIKANFKGDLFSAAQLRMLYDPQGDKRCTDRLISLELNRHGAHRCGVVRTSTGVKRLLAVRNVQHWQTAPGTEIAEHYETNNPPMPGKKGKF